MEFEVDGDGRMMLRRFTRFSTQGDTGINPYGWLVSLGVEGMAGAVTFRMVGSGHRSQEPWQAVPGSGFGMGVVWTPRGYHAHAYRPWPGPSEDGKLPGLVWELDRGMFSQSLDTPELTVSGELMAALCVVGGQAKVWSCLEHAYAQELCPPSPDRDRIAQLEATLAAYQRTSPPPSLAELTGEPSSLDPAPRQVS